MTSALLRRFGPLLLGGTVALGLTATAKSEELRIGYLAPTTGIFAQVGKDMVDGFKMYLDEKNNKFGGADVKFIVEDEQGKPDTAVTKAKKLILQDKVHFFVGGLLASTGYALAPVSTAEKVVYISSGRRRRTTSPSATLPKYPYFYPHRLVELAAEPSVRAMGLRPGLQEDCRIIAADYAFGYEVVGGFQRAFEACGGQIVQKIWPPLTTKDFGPYIPTLKADADAIFTVMVGPDVAAIPQAAGGDRQQEAGDRRRHRAMTSSCCPRWATR